MQGRAYLLGGCSLDLILREAQLARYAVRLRQQAVYPRVELLGGLNLKARLQQCSVPQRLSIGFGPLRLLVLLHLQSRIADMSPPPWQRGDGIASSQQQRDAQQVRALRSHSSQ